MATKWMMMAPAALALSACQKQAQPPLTREGPASAAPTTSVAMTSAASVTAPPAQVVDRRVWSFDALEPDATPPGFGVVRTGEGKEPRFRVKAVADAPSKPNVLEQSDADETSNRYPIAVAEGTSFENVDLSVSCKAVAGKIDQACGLVWRYRDVNNYYVTRSNALEDNVRIYYVKAGKRVQLGSWSGKVFAGVWSKLRVQARGNRFVVHFAGQQVLDVQDTTFSGPGQVGIWTKADSVTQFDDLSARPL